MQKETRESVVNFFSKAKPGKILDVPSGSAWLSKSMKTKGWDYYGVDLYADLSNSDSDRFKVADINKTIPFDDQTFNYFACLEGIEHLENPHHILREASRLLKPEGVLLISTPNPLNIKNRRKYYRSGTFLGFPHLIDMPSEGDHVHITPINASFLIAFAEKYGLEFLSLEPIKVPVKMYRFFHRCIFIKIFSAFRYLKKDKKTKEWMKRLCSFNMLLNDGMVLAFKKPAPRA
jgi:2-polyprenyl-3-methyl-5-hydroxy-6-metoxy-1,4-benzoquinol methylase